MEALTDEPYLESFLQLDPRTFDQDPQKGRRSIQAEPESSKRFVLSAGKDAQNIDNALKVMIYYLEHYDFTQSPEATRFKSLLRWHI